MSFKKILVAINKSPLGADVFMAALEQAKLNQAVLKLLHCTEMIAESTVPMAYEPGLQPSLTSSDYQTQRVLIEEQIEQAQVILERYRQAAFERGVTIEADYQVGQAGHVICQAAKEWKADLVVIGRQERSGLAGVFRGSVSNYVVHNAPCSVLVIQEVESETREKAISNLSSVPSQPTPS